MLPGVVLYFLIDAGNNGLMRDIRNCIGKSNYFSFIASSSDVAASSI